MFRNSGEGPWNTEEEAKAFADAEIGLPWRALETEYGWMVAVDDPDGDGDVFEVCECGHAEISDGYGGNDCPDCGQSMRVLRR